MPKKRSRPRLVRPHDPANVFDDLDALRRAQTAPAADVTDPRLMQQIAEESGARLAANFTPMRYRDPAGQRTTISH
jgi:hypothetical protein